MKFQRKYSKREMYRGRVIRKTDMQLSRLYGMRIQDLKRGYERLKIR